MATYLVTGGAGFIGSNLVARLLHDGERVRVLDDGSTGDWRSLDAHRGNERLDVIEGDIRDPAAAARAVEGVEIVLHHAALGSVPRSIEDPVRSNDVNVGGTVTMLDAARHAGVRRFIAATSSSAYGDTEELPKHEGMPSRPKSPYAVSKVACENYVAIFAKTYGMETLCLRYFNVFGPGQRPDAAYAAAIPIFGWAALNGETITIHGDGETSRDFSFVDNAVSANLLAATTAKRLEGQVCNIATGRRVTLNRIVREIRSRLGKAVRVVHGPPRPGDVRHSLADISRAHDLFGYEPLVMWEDGLDATLEFLRGYQPL